MAAKHKHQPKHRSPKRRLQFADPWRFRRLSSVCVAASDINGRPLTSTTHKQGGQTVTSFRVKTSSFTKESSKMEYLRRQVAAEIARYRSNGICSDYDIELVVALWLDGKTLRQFARERGVTPAAVGDHIGRLRYKCIRFHQWWTLKNRRRREACQRQWQ